MSFLLWIIIIDWRKPIADVRELDLLSDPDHKGYADLHCLLPPELGIYRLVHHRRDRVHHAPDFQLWVDRLPRHWRVIILAVSPLTHFDREEALNLMAALNKLRARGKGPGRVRRRPLAIQRHAQGRDGGRAGRGELRPDLEMAVARAMNRVQEIAGAETRRRFAVGA